MEENTEIEPENELKVSDIYNNKLVNGTFVPS